MSTQANGKTRTETTHVAHPPVTTQEPAPATRPAPALSSAGKLSVAQVQAMKALGIEYSEQVEERHLKILLWGDTSTRKTETVLRNFPNVLLIDAEGNSDQCVRNKHIPPFQRVKTQDSRRVLEVLDKAAQGLIRMPNGDPILTLCIDSISVIWSVQQEVAATLAEKKAQRFNRSADEASITMQDWNKAKRPIKSVLNRFAKTQIPFLILIAREKPLYEELPGGELKRIGVTPNMVRDTEYDMNLALHFLKNDSSWGYEVTKVQGGLGEIFPLGGRGSILPLDKLFDYAAHLKPEAVEAAGDDEDLAEQIASTILRDSVERTQSHLIRYASEKGFSAAELGVILKEQGFKGFDPNNWEKMIQAVDAAVQG